jgi:urate oxidase
MALIGKTYGKGRVRVMRVHRAGERHEPCELTIRAMIEGDFGEAYTDQDNSTTIATDSIKNIVNIVAHDNVALPNELFCLAVARKLLDTYGQLSRAVVSGHETRWKRLAVGGKPHPHSFTLDNNGTPFAQVTATRAGHSTVSGIDGITFMKTTASGWSGYIKDRYTTIPETRDRLLGTAMTGSWLWASDPADFPAVNAKILETLIENFATTFSESMQDSLYRMGEAALAAVPEVKQMTLACPNKHYLPINYTPFGLDNTNQVFLPTDEPHGQIECTVGR